jgi:hypothetical protein
MMWLIYLFSARSAAPQFNYKEKKRSRQQASTAFFENNEPKKEL